jgi:hypothetical protein
MKISMGGERLGARTHGGQDPPHRAVGFVDVSTLSGGGAPSHAGNSVERGRGAAASASVERRG